MGSYTITKNTQLVVNLPEDFSLQGWTVSQGTAIHSGCNSGYIRLNIDLSSSTNWTFRYNISNLTSGTVNIVVNGVSGIVRSMAGIYEEEFVVNDPNALIQFYATGETSLQILQIYPESEAQDGTTFAFNEDNDRWVTYYSYMPEFMAKFINSFFAFDNGRLWEQNVNEVRNNFFGVQYPSVITFYCNLNPTEVKNFYSMRQKSNKVWSVPSIEIPARYGKPNGQKSRLKTGRFRNLQGDWFSDFLRDMEDSRFVTTLDALMKGAELQGNYMKITIQNDDTTEVKLFSVDITISKNDYTY